MRTHKRSSVQRGVDPPGLFGLLDCVPGPHGPGRGYASPPGLRHIVLKAILLFNVLRHI